MKLFQSICTLMILVAISTKSFADPEIASVTGGILNLQGGSINAIHLIESKHNLFKISYQLENTTDIRAISNCSCMDVVDVSEYDNELHVVLHFKVNINNGVTNAGISFSSGANEFSFRQKILFFAGNSKVMLGANRISLNEISFNNDTYSFDMPIRFLGDYCKDVTASISSGNINLNLDKIEANSQIYNANFQLKDVKTGIYWIHIIYNETTYEMPLIIVD